MTPDERLERSLREGLVALAGNGATPPIDDILARTSRTRQRRARLPFHRSDPPSGAPGALPGTSTWRPRMLSTVRFGAIGALVLAVGLTLPTLLGGTGPADSLASPAPSDAPGVGATWVTGTITPANMCTGPATSIEMGVGQHRRGYRCEDQVWSADDPRLAGIGATTWNADTYPTTEGTVTLSATTMELSNDAGTWRCTSTIGHFPEPVGHEPLPRLSDCTGGGAYAGLVAIVTVDGGTTPPAFRALILDGDLPPAP